MKLEELNIVVITNCEERNIAIQEALFKKGGYWNSLIGKVSTEITMVKSLYLIIKQGRLQYGDAMINILNETADVSEVTFEQALAIIENIEEPQRDFDIEDFEQVLTRDTCIDCWGLNHYYGSNGSHLFKCSKSNMGQMIKYKDYKHLKNTTTTPDEYWTVENGKPVLKFK